jgi:hypothetical protein
LLKDVAIENRLELRTNACQHFECLLWIVPKRRQVNRQKLAVHQHPNRQKETCIHFSATNNTKGVESWTPYISVLIGVKQNMMFAFSIRQGQS